MTRPPDEQGQAGGLPPEEAHQMFAHIFNASSNAMAFTDAVASRIVDVNPTWTRISGVSRDEARGKTAFQLGLWPNAESRQACLAEFTRAGRLVDYEIALTMRSGTRIVMASAERITLPSGNFVLWEFRDITERTQTQIALQESQRRFRAIFDQTFQFIGLLDVEGRVVEANRTALEFSGVDASTVFGKPFWETPWWSHDPLQQAALQEAIAKAAAGGFVRFEATHPGADGKLHHIDFSLKPVFDAAGKVTMLIPEGRDITDLKESEAERRRLQERMQQTEKLESLGILAGGIAHDFNNLLTVVMGNASLAMMELPEHSPTLELLDAVAKAAQRAADLAHQMLTYSGHGKLSATRLHLDHTVEETCRLLAPSIAENAELQFELEPALVLGDATQLRQVVMNLLLNASDALAGNPGRISLRTGTRRMTTEALRSTSLREDLPAGHYGFVEIEDTGVGMTPDIMSRIYDPFFSTKTMGRGLGLSATLGIVRSHRGALVVTSTPGQGSRFCVYLPGATAEAPPPEPIDTRTDGNRGKGAILVVEDDETVRHFVDRTLRSAGFRTLLAADGQQGLSTFAARRDEIEGIVIDQAMPNLEGIEVAERIRESGSNVPILLMSGFNPIDDAERRRVARASFLPKPFEAQTLLQAVARVLNGESPATS